MAAMSDDHKLSAAELESRFASQLGFLTRSCDAYDAGLTDEYQRIAIVCRVLFHESPSSRSLVRQLGLEARTMLSTALPFEPQNIGTHAGLTVIRHGGRAPGFAAPLDDPIRSEQMSLPDWWREVVISDNQQRKLSRQDLI